MCFVWIWGQTAIISLYNINWLVVINESQSVYCAVRTKSSNKIPVNFSLWGRVMAQAVSRRPLITEVRAGTQVSLCEICVRLSDTGTGFSPSTFVVLYQYHSIIFPYEVIIFICMLLLPEGQEGQSWQPSRKKRSVENTSHFLVFVREVSKQGKILCCHCHW